MALGNLLLRSLSWHSAEAFLHSRRSIRVTAGHLFTCRLLLRYNRASVLQLALKHRQGKNHKMRIIAFVGSPVEDNEKDVSNGQRRAWWGCSALYLQPHICLPCTGGKALIPRAERFSAGSRGRARSLGTARPEPRTDPQLPGGACTSWLVAVT